MNDGDMLVRMCCSCPTDRTAQLVLADWLAENQELECEAAIRSDATAVDAIREVYRIADILGIPPNVRLLWTVVVVAPHFFVRSTVGSIDVIPPYDDGHWTIQGPSSEIWGRTTGGETR